MSKELTDKFFRGELPEGLVYVVKLYKGNYEYLRCRHSIPSNIQILEDLEYSVYNDKSQKNIDVVCVAPKYQDYCKLQNKLKVGNEKRYYKGQLDILNKLYKLLLSEKSGIKISRENLFVMLKTLGNLIQKLKEKLND